MRSIIIAAPFLLTACVAEPRPQAADTAAPPFPVLRFFEGRTEGRGTLKAAFKSREAISVQSVGRVGADGTLVVQQTITEGRKPARTREWRIREMSPGRYSGTLTDASGPVSGQVEGNRLHLSLRMKGGLDAEQWLTLAGAGRSAHNIMVVRKLGVTVAALNETIRKLD